jgi:hypothetical protein
MKRTRHTPEQVINKLREADTMLSSGPERRRSPESQSSHIREE